MRRLTRIPFLLPAALVAPPALASGVEGEAAATSLAAWIRSRLPDAMLERVFLLEIWQWLALLAIAFFGVVVDRIVRWVLGVWLHRLLAASEQFREKELDASFGKPVGILSMALTWWLLLPVPDLPADALAVLQLAARFVMAAASVWGIYRLVDVVAAHFGALAARTDSKLDDILVPLARRAVKVVTLAFVVLFIAQNLNVDITSLLAGLGIGGIAFALAAKDTVENVFGSVTVLIDRPFQIGDWVVIGDQEGTVEEIGFRSTRLRTFYNSKITIPNSQLVNSAVDNLGDRRYRRFKCMVSIEYGTPPEKIEAFCEGIRELIRRHPYTRKDYYMVYLNELSDSSLNVLLYVFHETPDWPTELRERHRLLVDILRLARGLGVEFAFPTRTLHLSSAPAGLAGLPDEPRAAEPTLSPELHEDSIRLGRDQAGEIMKTLWNEAAQPPVSFADPEKIRPAAGGAEKAGS